MKKINMKATVGQSFILAGAIAIGAGAVYALASTSLPFNESAQKSKQAREQDNPSEFETSPRAAQLNLSDEQKTRIPATGRAGRPSSKTCSSTPACRRSV